MSNEFDEFENTKPDYPDFGQHQSGYPNFQNGSEQTTQFDNTSQTERVVKMSKFAQCGVTLVAFIVLSLLFIFIVNIITGVTSKKESKPVETQQVVIEEPKTVEETKSTELATTKERVTEVPKTTHSEYLPASAISKEVLSNSATVEQIGIVSENKLLAMFEVTFKMGSTNFVVMLNYDQAQYLSVGETVKISYSKVEGYDKVIIRSID